MMEDEFTEFERLKRNDEGAEEACAAAAALGKDFFFQIRMLREVYDLDMGAARDVAARANAKTR
jgi:hypothetical protein